MSQNFVACDRAQVLLMPPSLADWVPDDHLVWTVLGAVEKMDLAGFYAAYRANGQGRAAHNPEMMVALSLYAYARGNRSSRGIERACREDVAYKVITAMAVPEIAIDATKIKASASRDQNRSYAGIVAEILDQAERIDREEGERHGEDSL